MFKQGCGAKGKRDENADEPRSPGKVDSRSFYKMRY